MTIMVTGASGLVGSHLCRNLVLEEHEVVGLTHSRRNQLLDSLRKYKNFKIVVGDIRDCEWHERIETKKIKTIFHLASHMPYTLSHDLEDVNVQGTINVLKLAQIADVWKFVFGSSMSVYSEPPHYLPVDEKHPTQPSSVYGNMKLAGECLCKSYLGLDRVTILRYSGIYGVGMDKTRAVMRFFKNALEGESIRLNGDGKQSSDYTHVKDIIQGTILAWQKGYSMVYNIGSGQSISATELAIKILSITKSKSEIIKSDISTDRPFNFYLNIYKSQKELGYAPHTLDDGLRLFYEGL